IPPPASHRAQAKVGPALQVDALSLVSGLHLLVLCRLVVRLARRRSPLTCTAVRMCLAPPSSAGARPRPGPPPASAPPCECPTLRVPARRADPPGAPLAPHQRARSPRR